MKVELTRSRVSVATQIDLHPSNECLTLTLQLSGSVDDR